MTIRRIKKIDRPFECKAAKADGTFEGHGSIFGELDSYRDIVMPGAFTKSLATFEERSRKVPMLWQHDSRNPIGIYSTIKEDATGLRVTGDCNMKVQQGVECHALMDQGALTGLSIGYSTIRDEWDEKLMVRRLFEVELWEISPVTFPANDGARVDTVKSIGNMTTLSDLERYLRESCGLSKKESLALMSKASVIVTRSDSANTEAAMIQRALHNLRS